MKKIILALLLTICLFCLGCSSSNLEHVKQSADGRWDSMGYEIMGYEGYERSVWWGGKYGGAKVWYTLKRQPDNGVTYTGFLYSWGDEIHVYNLRAIDAIKPN